MCTDILVRSCGLLEAAARRPSALADTFSRLLAECPAETRGSGEALLAQGTQLFHWEKYVFYWK